MQLVRSRVEHLNTVIKQHQMFKGEPYRGWMKNLACFVKVTLHATAVEIRKREERDGPRYAGYGWWLVAPPVGAGNTYRQDTFRKIRLVRY